MLLQFWALKKVLVTIIGSIIILSSLGLSQSAFAQTADPFSTGPATPVQRGSPSFSTSVQQSQVCTLINFEGVGNFNPVGTIGAATFSNARGSVDSDAGGTGGFANEPSPDTVMITFFQTTFATVILDNPANEIRVFHSSLGPSEMRVFNAANNLLATIPLPQTPIGPGDPNGGLFGTWLQVIHSEPSAVIKKVEFDGAFTVDRTAYDNFEFCTGNGLPVGGEFIGVDATMVLVAGTQTTAAWMIPVIVSAIGIGIVIARKF